MGKQAFTRAGRTNLHEAEPFARGPDDIGAEAPVRTRPEGAPPGDSAPTAPRRDRSAGGATPFLAGLDPTDSSSTPDPLGRVEAQDRLARLLEHGKSVESLHVGAAILVFLVFSSSIPRSPLLTWLGTVVVVASIRFLARRRLLRAQRTGDEALPTIRGFALAMGTAWGLGPVALHASLSSSQFYMLMMVFAGIVAGGVSSFALDRASFNRLSASLVGLLAFGIGISPQVEGQWVALSMTALFFVGMQGLHARTHASLLESMNTSARLRRAERAAGRERAFLDALISSAPTAIAAVDRRGAVLGVNPAFERLFAYDVASVTGKDLDQLIVPDEQRDAAAELFQRVRRGEMFQEDLVRCRSDGTPVPVRVSAAVTDTDEGAVFVLYDDRTAEVRASMALTEAERHYRELVESSSDLVWTVDRRGRWSFLNNACHDVYRCAPGDLLGKPLADRVCNELQTADQEMLRRVFVGEEVSDYETVHLDLLGERKHLSFSARPVRSGSADIVGAQGTARDVTQRAAVRGALETARELALRAAATRTTFLANMSHEMRTPMNGVLGMLEVLSQSDLDDDQRKTVDVVRSSGQALLALIDDVLDFSKLETGLVQLEEIDFDLRGMVETALRPLEVEAENKGLEFTCHLDADVREQVTGDPGRLRQVLTNLVGNAIKFTDRGRVTVAVEADGDASAGVRFTVRDTGIGISEDDLPGVFDQFTQADPSTTRRFGGSGLGLSICHGLVGIMGGDISVTSRLGEGSEFTFWIPLRASEGHPRVHDPVSVHPLRVLVVDDDESHRRTIEDALTQAEIEVEVVSHSTPVCDRLERGSGSGTAFDLVIVDHGAAGADGFGLAAEIRERPGLSTLPILILTTSPCPGDGRRCRDLGIGGYLPKPVMGPDLIETVSRIMRLGPEGAPPPQPVTRHTISEARRTLSLLLVEDNPLNQQVAVALLERRGHQVKVVDDGLEALDAVAQDRFDVVLMDIQLPGIDGVEATLRIRDTLGPDELPIIALTAHAFSEERERALGAGMNAFLSKPFRPYDLFAAVEGWGSPRDVRARTDDEPSTTVDVESFRREMRVVGIEHVVDDTLSTFCATVDERIRALSQAADEDNLSEVARLAYGFKSSAMTIHAHRLSGALETLEAAAGSGTTREVTVALGRVERAAHEAVEFLARSSCCENIDLG